MGLFIVADGMGGYTAGEVASAIAVTTIFNQIKQGLRQLKPRLFSRVGGYSKESVLIRQAIIDANSAIYHTARLEEQCLGMGTTVIAVLFYNDRLTVGHVGDSRLYRMRDGRLAQVTSDHSLVQELINRGLFTPEEAHAHTPKNLVTRALGIEETVEVDIHEDEVQPGDIYLLCTDGLNDMIDDDEISLTLNKYNANLVVAAQELIKRANQCGGKDNISVILARPRARFPAGKRWRSGWWRKWFKKS
jgi:protein phosphatase